MSEHERSGDDRDLRALDKIRDAHVAALNAGDAAAWVAQFAEDGVQMPPHAPANLGKESISAWSQGLLGQFRAQFALQVDEVRVLNDWAFERGRYSITLAPKAGGPSLADAGKYITLYQRGAGELWRMARDIWNSNHPLPGQ